MSNLFLRKSTHKNFDWFNFENAKESDAFNVELYLDDVIIDSNDPVLYKIGKERLQYFALDLINHENAQILIGLSNPNQEWGFMPLDMIRITKGVFGTNYKKIGLSQETKKYHTILADSGIEDDYVGLCECNNFKDLFSLIIDGTLIHIFDYMHIIDVDLELLFYFHHTFEIGIYYKSPDMIHRIEYIAENYNFKLRK